MQSFLLNTIKCSHLISLIQFSLFPPEVGSNFLLPMKLSIQMEMIFVFVLSFFTNKFCIHAAEYILDQLLTHFLREIPMAKNAFQLL